MLTYKRSNGSTIELADTLNMRTFAEKQGWSLVIKSSSKEPSEDIEIPTFKKKKRKKHG